MSLIAFDLDGVLMTDILVEPSTFDQVNFFRNSKFFPLFRPIPPYILITGRPVVDKPLTLSWLDIYELNPLQLYHENTDIKTAMHYKASVLNSRPDISLYIESCPIQVEYLTKTVNTKVVHFETMIKGALNEILSSL